MEPLKHAIIEYGPLPLRLLLLRRDRDRIPAWTFTGIPELQSGPELCFWFGVSLEFDQLSVGESVGLST